MKKLQINDKYVNQKKVCILTKPLPHKAQQNHEKQSHSVLDMKASVLHRCDLQQLNTLGEKEYQLFLHKQQELVISQRTMLFFSYNNIPFERLPS